MEHWETIAGIYFLGINLLGFLSMGIDKKRAKDGEWRISERSLFFVALLGGSLGSILGMQVFRHKTKHRSFRLGMPLILAVQLILLGILLGLSGKRTERTDFVMATVMTQVLYGPDGKEIADEDYQIVSELERDYLSWRSGQSSVTEINTALSRGEAVALDARERQWLEDGLALCRDSRGALDITIHPIIALWGIETDTPQVPKKEEIQQALTHTGYDRLTISEDGILTGRNDSSIDYGALGKGIACDELRSRFANRNLTGAVISIGGTILVYGRKPGGGDWQIGIRDPRGTSGSLLGTLKLREPAVVSTSGDYERYFEEDGIRYHHIFNPDTGYPADSGLISVTVVSEKGIVSDGLSTACLVAGYRESLPLLEQYQADAIFVTENREVYVTEGLKDRFSLTAEAYQYMNEEE